MSQLRVEPMSARFSIVKDHLWCVYDGDRPLFHGTASECRDWLDCREAQSLHPFDSVNDATRSLPPSFWSRFFQFSSGR
jgi:hypothetical protein